MRGGSFGVKTGKTLFTFRDDDGSEITINSAECWPRYLHRASVPDKDVKAEAKKQMAAKVESLKANPLFKLSDDKERARQLSLLETGEAKKAMEESARRRLSQLKAIELAKAACDKATAILENAFSEVAKVLEVR